MYCPDDKVLSNMKSLSIWAEGEEGNVHLEVEAISGYSCSIIPRQGPLRWRRLA